MPRIPRADSDARYQIADMPHLVGDGWTAPGKATQQLGQAIGQVGKAFAGLEAKQDAEADAESMHEARIAALNLKNEWDLDEINTQGTYNGDGKDYAAERTSLWNQKLADYQGRYGNSSPKVRRFVDMFGATTTGQVAEGAARFGRSRYEGHLVSQTESAVTGQLAQMATPEAAERYKADPAAYEADLRLKIQETNKIIDALPLKDQRADTLRRKAAGEIEKIIEAAPAGISVPAVRRMIEEFSTTPTVPQVPGGSNPVPGPQSGLPTEELTKRVSASEFFGPGVNVENLPLGMRASNNPTNIKYSGSAYQRESFPGLIGPSSAKDQGDPQALFANPLAGMVAGARLALTKQSAHGLDTVEKLITDPKQGWTPGYKAAAEHVASLMGVKPTDKIDLRNPETMQKFMRALITQEHGASGKLYSDDLIRRGTDVALAGPGAERSQVAPASPGKVGIGVGKFVPTSTPGVITAAATQEERTTNGRGYGAQLSGSITVNGRTYEWVSGGSGRGSIPTGTYQIQRFTSGTQRASEGRSFRRDAFELNSAQDDIGRAANEAKRDGLLIHDARAGMTAGCLGIKGDFDQFKRDLATEQARNGGRVAVQIGTQKQLAGVSRETNTGVSQGGQQIPTSTGPVQADDGPARVFFDADRNYTKTEVDNLVKKHGPNIVIGGNPDNEGYKEMATYAREKGAKVHAYTKGPGEPEFGYNGDGKVKFPGDHEEIKKAGFSVADWQKGGKWLEAGRQKLLEQQKAGEAPYSVEWDNINDRKPGELRDLLADQTRWAKENGVATRVVLKNLNARQWQAVNQGIEQGKIDKALIAPFAIVEEHMADGDRQAAEAEAKRQGIAQFRTENTLRYASPADGFERPTNRIPGGGANDNSRLPVQQAQLRPSVESHLTKSLLEKLPALERKRIGEAMAAVKQIDADADRGVLPDERSQAMLGKMIADTGDKGVSDLYQNAIIKGQINAQYKALPPAVITNDLNKLKAQLATQGAQFVPKRGGGPETEGETGMEPALALTRKRIEALDKLQTRMTAELKKDPTAWAVEANVVTPLPELTRETFSPELLRLKAEQTEAIANHYGEEFRQYFSPGEKEHLKALFSQGGKPMIAMAGMMVESYGPKAVKAIGEIAKDAPEAAHLGWLIVNKADNQVVKDLAAAVELQRTREQQKGKEIAGLSTQYVSDQFHDKFKATLGFMSDDVRDRILHNAKVLYDYRVGRTGEKIDSKNDPKPAILERAFRDLLGENKVNNVTYGGIAPVTSWFSNQASVPIHLPANIKQDAFYDLMGSLRNSDFGWTIQKPDGAGGGMPETKPEPRTPSESDVPSWRRQEGASPAAAAAPTADVKARSEVASNVPADMREGAEAAMRAAGALPQMAMTNIDRSGAVRGAPLDYKGRPMTWSTIANRGTFITVGEGKYKVAMGNPFSNDQQIVGSTAGGHFVIDLNDPSLQRILRERNPNAFRPY